VTVKLSRLIAVLAVLWSGSAMADDPKPVALCEIVQHPSAYQGLIVRTRGRYNSDCLERSVFVSAECRLGIELDAPDRIAGHAFDEVCVGPPGMPWRNTVRMTVTGKFEWKPQARPAFILHATSITDVTIKRPRHL